MRDIRHANVLTAIGVVWRKGDRPKVVLPYMELGDLCNLLRMPHMVSFIVYMFENAPHGEISICR